MPALLAPSLRSRERTRPERLHRMCPPALASDREESAWVARQGRPERETRRLGCVEYTSATTTYSRTTSFASLSVRSPRKTGWRSWSSDVHSVNLTCATSTGLTQWQRFITAGVIPSPHLPRDFSGRLMNGQVARLIFCNCASMLARSFSEKPLPTLPANKSPAG